MDKGTSLNFTQSINCPVTISQTRMDLSIELHKSHFDVGCEKQTSVILLFAALAN
jgi:hypothetical protein